MIPAAATTIGHKLKMREIYFLPVPEARSLKSVSLNGNQGVVRAVLAPEALGKDLFLASFSFWWHLVFH